MKFYKDANDIVFAYELDGSQDLFIPNDQTPITEEEANLLRTQPLSTDLIKEAVTAARGAAYVKESDPLFFKYQRGEAFQEDWLAKVAEIKARYPDGVLPVYIATP